MEKIHSFAKKTSHDDLVVYLETMQKISFSLKHRFWWMKERMTL
jgi:hypothetical protein